MLKNTTVEKKVSYAALRDKLVIFCRVFLFSLISIFVVFIIIIIMIIIRVHSQTS